MTTISNNQCNYSEENLIINSTKRKREEEKDQGIKCVLKKFREDFDEGSNDTFPPTLAGTKCVSYNKFKRKFLDRLSPELTYVERITLLRNFCSKQEKEYDLYICLDPAKKLDVKLTIQQNPFKSSILREEYFREPTIADEKQVYDVVRLYENITDGDDNYDTRVLKIYSSVLGSKGELAWVQKGGQLCGSKVLSLYGELQKILKIKEMVLYDDANFEVQIGNFFKKISQRKLMALSSRDEMGLSWYEARAGFIPDSFDSYQTQTDDLSQDPAFYRKAIIAVRNTQLTLVQKTHKTAARFIVNLSTRYVSDHSDPTIHQLVKAMNSARQNVQTKEQADKDMYLFFKKVISTFPRVRGRPQRTFIDALTTLEETRIFVKKI